MKLNGLCVYMSLSHNFSNKNIAIIKQLFLSQIFLYAEAKNVQESCMWPYHNTWSTLDYSFQKYTESLLIGFCICLFLYMYVAVQNNKIGYVAQECQQSN